MGRIRFTGTSSKYLALDTESVNNVVQTWSFTDIVNTLDCVGPEGGEIGCEIEYCSEEILDSSILLDNRLSKCNPFSIYFLSVY